MLLRVAPCSLRQRTRRRTAVAVLVTVGVLLVCTFLFWPEPTEAKLERDAARLWSRMAAVDMRHADDGSLLSRMKRAASVDRFHTLAERHALRKGTVLITVVTMGMLDFTLNWMASLHATGVTDYVVIAEDGAVYRELCIRGVPTVLFPLEWQTVGNYSVFPLPIDGRLHQWGENTYLRIVRSKLFAIHHVLALGYNVILSDVDVAFPQRGIFDHMLQVEAEQPEALMVASQEPDIGCAFKGVTTAPCLNTGLIYLRSTPETIGVVRTSIEWSVDVPALNVDQFAFNWVVYKRGWVGAFEQIPVAGQPLPKKLAPTAPGKLVPIDHNLAMNGLYFFADTNFAGRQPKSVVPLAVHANYLVGADKITRMKARNLWVADPGLAFPISEHAQDPLTCAASTSSWWPSWYDACNRQCTVT